MVRGSTPDYVLRINADLTGMIVYVTIAQPGRMVTLDMDELRIVPGTHASYVHFRLTQEESLRLRPGRAYVQMHFVPAESGDDDPPTDDDTPVMLMAAQQILPSTPAPRRWDSNIKSFMIHPTQLDVVIPSGSGSSDEGGDVYE